MNRRIVIGLCFFLLLISWCAEAAQEAICADTNVILCDNMEDRTLGTQFTEDLGAKNWAYGLDPPNSGIVVSNDIAFNGTKSMKFAYPACSWTSNQATNCGTGYLAPMFPGTSKPEIYFRHYVYWQPGFLHGASPNKIDAIQTYPTGKRRPWLFHYHGADRISYFDDEGANEQTYAQNVNLPATAFQNGQWYCLESHVKQNGNGSATFEGWIDDVLKISYPNASVDTGSGPPGAEPWGNLLLSGYWNAIGPCGIAGQPGCVAETQATCLADGHSWNGSFCVISQSECQAAGYTWNGSACSKGAFSRYYDNIVVSTARIGCLGSAPQTPAAPSNLRCDICQ